MITGQWIRTKISFYFGYLDPPEVVKMDQETVHKIQKSRAEYQLAAHEKEELNHSRDYVMKYKD